MCDIRIHTLQYSRFAQLAWGLAASTDVSTARAQHGRDTWAGAGIFCHSGTPCTCDSANPRAHAPRPLLQIRHGANELTAGLTALFYARLAKAEASGLAVMLRQLLPQVEGGDSWEGKKNSSRRAERQPTADKTRRETAHVPSPRSAVSYFIFPAFGFRASSASSVMSLHRWCKYTVTGFSLHVWTTSRTPLREHLPADKASSAPDTRRQR